MTQTNAGTVETLWGDVAEETRRTGEGSHLIVLHDDLKRIFPDDPDRQKQEMDRVFAEAVHMTLDDAIAVVRRDLGLPLGKRRSEG